MKLKSITEKTNHFMKIAISEALKAKRRDEVPVGSVIIDKQNNIVSKNGNRIIELSDPTAHAEILCIREASEKIKNERLLDFSMRANDIARIKTVYFGAFDPNGGAIENGIKLYHSKSCNYKPDFYGGFKEKESSEILKSYFKTKRL